MDIGNGLLKEWLIKQGTLGVILGLAMYFGFANINARFDSVNARIDGIQADLKADIQEIKEGQKLLIGYMKDHEGRIANIEGRLDVMERQQQPAT